MVNSSEKYAVVISPYHTEVAKGLLHGTRAYFAEKGLHLSTDDIFEAPGAFEIPLLAQKLAKTNAYAGIVCLGCVIKGETAHFEYISLGASIGLIQGMLNTEIPISFGILTTYTDEQAIERSQDNAHNKGREAAAACYQTAQALSQIEKLHPPLFGFGASVASEAKLTEAGTTLS